MSVSTAIELLRRLNELCDQFRAEGCIACDVALDESHTRFDDKGIGLWSIDQRLRTFEAMLDVEAAAGRGTTATVILPARLITRN